MSAFIVFVDKQDGDVYQDSTAVAGAVKHALDNGALIVVVKEFPLKERRGRRHHDGGED